MGHYKPLTVEAKDGELQISIGVNTLKHAAQNSPCEPLTWFDEKQGEYMSYDVLDGEEFAKDVCRALRNEDEEGTTPVHRLLDKACWKAIEDGSGAVSEEPTKIIV